MQEKKQVIVALGSNQEPMAQIQKAQDLLRRQLPHIKFTPSIWTAPIGIISQRFVNCIGIAQTRLSMDILQEKLKKIETECGDTPSDRKRNIVWMDIDLLLFGHQKLHLKDWERPYIQSLLNDIGAYIPKNCDL